MDAKARYYRQTVNRLPEIRAIICRECGNRSVVLKKWQHIVEAGKEALDDLLCNRSTTRCS